MANDAMRAATIALLLWAAGVPRAHSADATVAATTDTTLAALAGTWVVDLRPSPEASPYDKPMTLAIAADRSVRGTFYESVIEEGQPGPEIVRAILKIREGDHAGGLAQLDAMLAKVPEK